MLFPVTISFDMKFKVTFIYFNFKVTSFSSSIQNEAYSYRIFYSLPVLAPLKASRYMLRHNTADCDHEFLTRSSVDSTIILMI
jgi:hypothetical protein